MSKLIKCKSCGAEIAKSAKTCPHCGAKKKPGCLSSVLGVIVLFLGIMLIVAALGGNDEPVAAPNKNADTQPQVSQANDTSKNSDKSAFGVGERAEMKDIYVTLESVAESKGSAYNAPTDGNVFVICEFTIENESNSELAISSLMSFTAYADDYTLNYSLGGIMEADKQQLDGAIAAGKKMNGIVAFEAPADWTEFEVHFSPNVYSSKEFVFIYSK